MLLQNKFLELKKIYFLVNSVEKSMRFLRVKNEFNEWDLYRTLLISAGSGLSEIVF